ncbi:MAG: SH3 domain-containing protein [Lachnospiraceae bacterium]|nr:SH3 domain-containing protein [Lachnospiraceae bacterium]
MRNKMHALLSVIITMIMTAAIVLGSMHDVYAAVKKNGSSKAVIVVKKASNTNSSSNSSNKTSDKTMPTIEITVGSEDDTATEEGSVAGIPYDELVMANVHEAVNIRSEASEDSSIIGKLFKDCGGQVLDSVTGWTKIKTGEVTGWVNNDYLLFGREAKELADSVVAKVATSTTSALRLRMEPNENAKVLDLLAEGDKIDVIEENDDWVKVEYSDGTQCYVSADYVTISYELTYGKDMETINAEEAEQKAIEEAASESASSSSKQETSNSTKEQSTGTVSTSPAPSAFDDVTLLAALIQCEAGNEIYEGQVAVGSAVVNRLKTGKYGNSLYSVIYAKSQFGPAGSGMVAQVAASGPKAVCIQAATEALSGASNIGTATSFRNVKSGHLGIVIGNHVFW